MAAFVYPETKYPRHVFFRGLRHDEFGVREQEQVAEGGAEVGPVQVSVLRGPGVVGLMAARAEHLHGELPRDV